MQISKERMVLTGNDAETIFGVTTPVDRDYSFHAFLRAIVLSRAEWTIKNIRELSGLQINRFSSTNDAIRDATESRDAIYIVEMAGDFDDGDIVIDGWKTFDEHPFPLNYYLSQITHTKVFVNEEQRRIIAFVKNRASCFWTQMFMPLLPKIMSWYYSPTDVKALMPTLQAITFQAPKKKTLKDDATEEEKKAAIESEERARKRADTKSEKALIAFVDEIAATINLREMSMRIQLNGVSNRQKRNRIKALNDVIQRHISTIEDYRRRLKSAYEVFDQDKLELSGLELVPDSDDDEIYDFFSKHKQLHVINVSDSGLKFGVDDVLEFYAEENLESALGRSNSFWYEDSGLNETMAAALIDIFVKRKGIFRVHAIFDLENFKRIKPRKEQSEITNAMPNPHIYFYACSGTNDVYYDQYAKSGEWELAIEQAISATKNINFEDSTVCKDMIRWLKRHSATPCIYYNGGKTIEFHEAIQEMELISYNDFIKRCAAETEAE